MPAPDVLLDLRAWLRTQPQLAALHGGRVFFRVPDQQVTYPLVRVYRVGGGALRTGETPVLYQPRVAVEVRGDALNMYDQVRGLALTLESVLNDAPPQPLNPPGGTTYLAGAAVTGSVDSPLPENGWPRYTLDVLLTVRVTGPAD